VANVWQSDWIMGFKGVKIDTRWSGPSQSSVYGDPNLIQYNMVSPIW